MYRLSKTLTKSYFALLILSASTAMASTPMDTGDEDGLTPTTASMSLATAERRVMTAREVRLLGEITGIIGRVTSLTDRIRGDLARAEDDDSDMMDDTL